LKAKNYKSYVSAQNKRARKARIAKPLTEDEKNIIRMICDERKSKDIAKELGKSIRTIETNRQIIMRKIDCESSIGIAMYAIKHGIYEIE
jgi:DNA-binding NarL/FixJ family response regulator